MVCLTLNCTLDTIEPRTTTKGPRGIRLQVNYQRQEGAVEFKAPLFENVPKGEVLSGSDFMLIRNDGVLELDGRITIRTADDRLIDLIYSGVRDLHAAAKLPDPAVGGDEARFSDAYRQFADGCLGLEPPDSPRLGLALAVKFETATGPWADDSGVDMKWIKKRYKVPPEHIQKYSALVRRQFVAKGVLTFQAFTQGQLPSASAMTLDVSELGV